MSMSLSHNMHLDQRLVLVQSLPFEVAGDFSLFSLHRIRHRIPSMKVDTNVRKKLVNELFLANKEYRAKSGNNWMCITPNYLDISVDKTKKYMQEVSNSALSDFGDTDLALRLKIKFDEKVEDQNRLIKSWFVDNYDDLIYKMDKPIPYPVVMKLRSQLSLWSLENTNPFNQPIGDFLEDIAIDIGLDYRNYDSTQGLWDAIGRYS